MELIIPTDIGNDEELARRVLVRARSIAPGIDQLDGEPKWDAIAVLKGVIAELPATGSRRIKSRSRNGTAITYSDVASAFTSDDVAALRSLVGASPTAGLPVGSFPEGRGASRMWPEEKYL